MDIPSSPSTRDHTETPSSIIAVCKEIYRVYSAAKVVSPEYGTMMVALKSDSGIRAGDTVRILLTSSIPLAVAPISFGFTPTKILIHDIDSPTKNHIRLNNDPAPWSESDAENIGMEKNHINSLPDEKVINKGNSGIKISHGKVTMFESQYNKVTLVGSDQIFVSKNRKLMSKSSISYSGNGFTYDSTMQAQDDGSLLGILHTVTGDISSALSKMGISSLDIPGLNTPLSDIVKLEFVLDKDLQDYSIGSFEVVDHIYTNRTLSVPDSSADVILNRRLMSVIGDSGVKKEYRSGIAKTKLKERPITYAMTISISGDKHEFSCGKSTSTCWDQETTSYGDIKENIAGDKVLRYQGNMMSHHYPVRDGTVNSIETYSDTVAINRGETSQVYERGRSVTDINIDWEVEEDEDSGISSGISILHTGLTVNGKDINISTSMFGVSIEGKEESRLVMDSSIGGLRYSGSSNNSDYHLLVSSSGASISTEGSAVFESKSNSFNSGENIFSGSITAMKGIRSKGEMYFDADSIFMTASKNVLISGYNLSVSSENSLAFGYENNMRIYSTGEAHIGNKKVSGVILSGDRSSLSIQSENTTVIGKSTASFVSEGHVSLGGETTSITGLPNGS